MNDELMKEMDRLSDTGDAIAFQRFFIERFSEFDPDEQEEIAVSVFLEALNEQASDEAFRPLQIEALDLAEKLKKLRNEMLQAETRQEDGDGGNTAQ